MKKFIKTTLVMLLLFGTAIILTGCQGENDLNNTTNVVENQESNENNNQTTFKENYEGGQNGQKLLNSQVKNNTRNQSDEELIELLEVLSEE